MSLMQKIILQIMNKILLLLVSLAVVMFSCQKELVTPNNEVCNCGLIVSDDVSDYSVTIRNSCSGNLKKFYLLEGDWFHAHPGSDYCISNVTSW